MVKSRCRSRTTAVELSIELYIELGIKLGTKSGINKPGIKLLGIKLGHRAGYTEWAQEALNERARIKQPELSSFPLD